jgi:hypothetical protein
MHPNPNSVVAVRSYLMNEGESVPIQIANAGGIANHAAASRSCEYRYSDRRYQNPGEDRRLRSKLYRGEQQAASGHGRSGDSENKATSERVPASIASIEEIRTSTTITISILLPAIPMGELVI